MKVSVFGKILITMVVVFVAAAAVFFREAHRTGHDLLASLSHARAHAIADVGLRTVERSMVRKNRNEISDYLNSLTTSHQARAIHILNARGEAVYSADTTGQKILWPITEYEQHPDYPEHKFLLIEKGGSTYERYVWPLDNGVECTPCHTGDDAILGYLGVEIPLDDVRDFAEKHRTSNITITIAIFTGLGLLLSLALLVLVVRPINRLQRHVKQLEEHIPRLQRGEPLPALEASDRTGGDEIASLGVSFQNLIQRLNEAYAELIELHDQQLERADQLASVGEMAASIAHEIKNPVTGVKAALQVFLRKVEDEDPRKEILEEMITQLDRITNAINDLLCYARSAPPEFSEVAMHEIIDRTVSMLRPEMDPRGVKPRLHLTEDADDIEADQKQVQQVLWNIMLNAVQSMARTGTLSIATMRDEGNLVVEIADTGEGMTRTEMDNIFRPFFTTKCKGSGLGMTIARRIMQQHGGGIHLSSKKGQGTNVRLLFPITQVVSE